MKEGSTEAPFRRPIEWRNPDFYDRDAHGLPRRWIARVRNAMQTLPYAFGAERMVIDYIEQMYQQPASSPLEK